MCYQFGQQVVSIGICGAVCAKKGEQVVHQLLVPPPAVVVVHHLQPVVGHFLKKVCHASVPGGYAKILFRKARAAGAAAAASAGGGSDAVQPQFSGSTAPLPSSTGLNRVKPLCEVPDPNEHVGWERPKTITQLRAFLGCYNYYHGFLPLYAKYSRPLTELLKVGKVEGKKGSQVKLKWTLECEEAFTDLK